MFELMDSHSKDPVIKVIGVGGGGGNADDGVNLGAGIEHPGGAGPEQDHQQGNQDADGGNHGDEYEGQIAISRLARELDPGAGRDRRASGRRRRRGLGDRRQIDRAGRHRRQGAGHSPGRAG